MFDGPRVGAADDATATRRAARARNAQQRAPCAVKAAPTPASRTRGGRHEPMHFLALALVPTSARGVSVRHGGRHLHMLSRIQLITWRGRQTDAGRLDHPRQSSAQPRPLCYWPRPSPCLCTLLPPSPSNLNSTPAHPLLACISPAGVHSSPRRLRASLVVSHDRSVPPPIGHVMSLTCLDHVVGRPSLRFRKIQVLSVLLFWAGFLLRGNPHGPPVPILRRLSRVLSKRLTTFQTVTLTLLYLYLARNFAKIFNLESPEPLANLYTRSYFRATWVMTALDAGFWTAMRIRKKWLRDLCSILFSVYYLFAAERADEKVRSACRVGVVY